MKGSEHYKIAALDQNLIFFHEQRNFFSVLNYTMVIHIFLVSLGTTFYYTKLYKQFVKNNTTYCLKTTFGKISNTAEVLTKFNKSFAVHYIGFQNICC